MKNFLIKGLALAFAVGLVIIFSADARRGNNQPGGGTPPPLPGQLVADTSFQWTGLQTGYKDDGNGNIIYEDFALTIFSSNPGTTQVTVEASAPGHTFVNNPVVFSLDEDSQVQWGIASDHIPQNPFDETEPLVFLPDVTITVTAENPVYVLPPTTFKASAVGTTKREAIKSGWWDGGNYGFEIPFAVETVPGNKKRFLFPYSIHWHNFNDWPVGDPPGWIEGWDTVFTITNGTNKNGSASVTNRPFYNSLHTCSPATPGEFDTTPLGENTQSYSVSKNSSVQVNMSDHLGITEGQSHHSEGGYIITVPNKEGWVVNAQLVSNPTGSQVCPVLP